MGTGVFQGIPCLVNRGKTGFDITRASAFLLPVYILNIHKGVLCLEYNRGILEIASHCVSFVTNTRSGKGGNMDDKLAPLKQTAKQQTNKQINKQLIIVTSTSQSSNHPSHVTAAPTRPMHPHTASSPPLDQTAGETPSPFSPAAYTPPRRRLDPAPRASPCLFPSLSPVLAQGPHMMHTAACVAPTP